MILKKLYVSLMQGTRRHPPPHKEAHAVVPSSQSLDVNIHFGQARWSARLDARLE